MPLLLASANSPAPLAGRKGRPVCAKNQRGVGMIEVLISIIIASFALLGLAGLQVSSLRYQKIAHFRMQATQQGADIADRIRANIAGAKNSSYLTPTSAKYADGAGTQPTCADTVTFKCTPAEVAALDLYNWRINLARGMPGGWGEISGNVANGFVAKIYSREPDKKDGLLDAKCRSAALVAADTDVRCFDMEFVP